jgi:hypothetical protein
MGYADKKIKYFLAVLFVVPSAAAFGHVSGNAVFGDENYLTPLCHFEGSIDSESMALSAYSSAVSAEEIIGYRSGLAAKDGERPVNSALIRAAAANILAITCGDWDGRWYYFASMDTVEKMTLNAAADNGGKCFYIRAVFQAGNRAACEKNKFDFEQYPGAREGREIRIRGNAGKTYGLSIFVAYNAAPEIVGSFYRESLLRSGWKLKERAGGPGTLFFAEKGGRVVAVGFSAGDESSTIITIIG